MAMSIVAALAVESSFGSFDLMNHLQGSQLIANDTNGDCDISEIDAVLAAMNALNARFDR